MAMTVEYVYKISSRYLQKWPSYDIKHVKTVISGFHRDFSNLIFVADFDTSKSVLRSFFAFFEKIWPKNL